MSELEEITDEIEEVSPWTDIWIRPRKTIDWITNNNSGILTTLILIYLGGVYFGIGQAELKNIGDRKEASNIITNSLLISGLGGLIIYNIFISAVDICASWFGGKGNFKKTQIAFAWSMVPSIVGIFLTLIGYIMFEEEIFTSETPNINRSNFLTIAFWTLATIAFILGVWHMVLLVVTIAQVQKLTILKSVLSIVTGSLLLVLPMATIILLISLIS